MMQLAQDMATSLRTELSIVLLLQDHLLGHSPGGCEARGRRYPQGSLHSSNRELRSLLMACNVSVGWCLKGRRTLCEHLPDAVVSSRGLDQQPYLQ